MSLFMLSLVQYFEFINLRKREALSIKIWKLVLNLVEMGSVVPCGQHRYSRAGPSAPTKGFLSLVFDNLKTSCFFEKSNCYY